MISVIIVTFNRISSVQETIKSLIQQDINEYFEIIIIDNCSPDEAAASLLNEYKARIKLIKNNTRQNLAYCKDLGILKASGNIIAFIDDDCLAARNWIKTIGNSIAGYDCLAGPVLPFLNSKFPWWWKDSLNWLIGINPKPNHKFLPLGSNVAFRKNILSKLEENKFKISGLLLPYAEDRIRLTCLLKAKLLMGINKEMIVYHRIPQQRLKFAYLIKRSYREGIASATLEREIKTIVFNIIALPVNPIKLILSMDLNYLFRTIVNFSYLINLLKYGKHYS